MTLADVELLCSPAGRALLEQLPDYDASQALALGERLRRQGHSPELVAAAMTQARLRARARAKLGEPARQMLLTADGLEQATRPALAARHAQRYVDAGIGHVVDLGCGLGLDAMAFAAAGLSVEAVDADPATAALAAHNLRDLPGVSVRCARAQDVAMPGAGAAVGVWFDPARRTPGRTDASGRTRRLFALDQLSPPWEFVVATAAAVPATGAKLSPGFPHGRIPDGAQAQWVSLDGEVLECALWFGPLAPTPGRIATVLRGDAVVGEVTGAGRVAGGARAGEGADERADEREVDGAAVGGAGGLDAAGLPRPGAWLHDPDRAVVRAGLVGALAAATGGVELGPGSGYVVTDGPVGVPWARRYAVLETLPADAKAIRAWARRSGVGRVTLKKRGSSVDPDRLRRSLTLGGTGAEGTLVLTSTGGRQIAVAVRAD